MHLLADPAQQLCPAVRCFCVLVEASSKCCAEGLAIWVLKPAQADGTHRVQAARTARRRLSHAAGAEQSRMRMRTRLRRTSCGSARRPTFAPCSATGMDSRSAAQQSLAAQRRQGLIAAVRGALQPAGVAEGAAAQGAVSAGGRAGAAGPLQEPAPQRTSALRSARLLSPPPSLSSHAPHDVSEIIPDLDKLTCKRLAGAATEADEAARVCALGQLQGAAGVHAASHADAAASTSACRGAHLLLQGGCCCQGLAHDIYLSHAVMLGA